MSISKRLSAAAATAKAAKSAASEPNPANRFTPDRRRFALNSPSRPIDHRQHAARRDLADIALAGRWFAPHYAIPERKSCGLSGADILGSDRPNAPRISQLLPGEDFAVVETSGDWAWGYRTHDHYVGYVQAEALVEAAEPTHIVTARSALIFAEPSSHAPVVAVLPMGSRISGNLEGEFVKTAQGFVPAQQLRACKDDVADPVETAEKLIGMPYLWGGRGLGGIDCSGLVQIAFGLAGIALPRDSDQQMTKGSEVTGDLRRGDLLFYANHVILLSAPDYAIHASGHWMSVMAEPLSDILARLGEPVARRRVLS